jgi:hypothetical protein
VGIIQTYVFGLLFSVLIPRSPPQHPITPCPGDQEADVEALMAVASDYIAEALDKRLGSDVTDHSIYRAHAAKYEVCISRCLDSFPSYRFVYVVSLSFHSHSPPSKPGQLHSE